MQQSVDYVPTVRSETLAHMLHTMMSIGPSTKRGQDQDQGGSNPKLPKTRNDPPGPPDTMEVEGEPIRIYKKIHPLMTELSNRMDYLSQRHSLRKRLSDTEYASFTKGRLDLSHNVTSGEPRVKYGDLVASRWEVHLPVLQKRFLNGYLYHFENFYKDRPLGFQSWIKAQLAPDSEIRTATTVQFVTESIAAERETFVRLTTDCETWLHTVVRPQFANDVLQRAAELQTVTAPEDTRAILTRPDVHRRPRSPNHLISAPYLRDLGQITQDDQQ